MAASPRRFVALYALSLGLALVLLAGVAKLGARLTGTQGNAGFGHSAGGAQLDLLLHVLLALIVIVGATRLLGHAGRWLGQPRVVGEIVAGIALGPSLLGHFAPQVAAFVLPSAVVPLIQVLAQVGVILFMFLVGIDLDPEAIRGKGSSAVAISHASMVLPFCAGAVLALWLYPRFGTTDVPFYAFALVLGISMSVTAFPVLARIIAERGLDKEPIGALALTCAAVDDVTAWCLLAVIVSVVESHLTGALVTFALVLAYVAVVVFVVRPLLVRRARVVEQRGAMSQADLAVVMLLVLGGALVTDAIGIHSLFGAFSVGACVPRTSALANGLKRRMEDLVIVLLLPAFFALTGMRTSLGLLDGSAAWLASVLVLLVACAGKLVGSAVAARVSGLSWREAGVIGVLMNTRGLMELVVLNIGMDLHIITAQVFAMLVLMAVLTTFMTGPLLALVWRPRPLDR